MTFPKFGHVDLALGPDVLQFGINVVLLYCRQPWGINRTAIEEEKQRQAIVLEKYRQNCM